MFQSTRKHRIPLAKLLNRHAHAVSCILLILFVSWGLLTPDPFAVVRNKPLSWISQLDDMILHCGAFMALSAAVSSLCLRCTRTIPLTAVVALCTYAIATELLQGFVVGRTCDPSDALANSLGITVGIVVTSQFWWLFALQKSHSHLSS